MTGPWHVLIVDDDPYNVDLLELRLQTQGHLTTVATNGAEALELCEQPSSCFDLLLIDVFMPGMNGFDLVCALRARSRWSQTPIIVISAGDRETTELAAIASGADAFVRKPTAWREFSILMARLVTPGGRP